VINCAGGYSDRIADLAGDDSFTIFPRSGEYMLMDKTEGTCVEHTLFQCPSKEGKGILVTPTVHGNLLVGPTATRVGSPACKGTTSAGLAVVQRLASKSVPMLNFRQVITSFAGVRASEKHGDFIIRASDKVSGLIHAAAIDSPGLTCCVSIADYLIQILEKQGLILQEKKVWNGTRADPAFFQKLSDEEKDAYIKINPTYGKIVCRCETISEGEIRQAIRTNPCALDVDGIKHRTRSGMGRCQGGFCSPYIMELISNELNIEMESVTKNGNNAPMLVGRIGEV
jgi:glycerol-3-phosphate dehydrogenase